MHRQLFQQARRLARLDPKKPKQINLRRAISSAYYALFHFLIDQSCRNAIGASHNQAPFRQVLSRAFEHNNIKNACISFAGGTLKAGISKRLPTNFVIPREIRIMASTYLDLHSQRNVADYDFTDRFRRSDVLAFIRQAMNCVDQFNNLPSSNEKKFFLACLWAWKTLTKR